MTQRQALTRRRHVDLVRVCSTLCHGEV
ncbi:putative leader peptide [Streptomyces sp. B1866]